MHLNGYPHSEYKYTFENLKLFFKDIVSYIKPLLQNGNIFHQIIIQWFSNHLFFYVSGMLLIYYFGVNGAFTFLQIKEKYLMYSIYGLEYARNRMVIEAQTIIPYKECYRKHVKLIESMIRLFCSIHFVMSNVGKPIMSLDIWKIFFLEIKV